MAAGFSYYHFSINGWPSVETTLIKVGQVLEVVAGIIVRGSFGPKETIFVI